MNLLHYWLTGHRFIDHLSRRLVYPGEYLLDYCRSCCSTSSGSSLTVWPVGVQIPMSNCWGHTRNGVIPRIIYHRDDHPSICNGFIFRFGSPVPTMARVFKHRQGATQGHQLVPGNHYHCPIFSLCDRPRLCSARYVPHFWRRRGPQWQVFCDFCHCT